MQIERYFAIIVLMGNCSVCHKTLASTHLDRSRLTSRNAMSTIAAEDSKHPTAATTCW
jgi:hypothetical protein